VAAARASLLVVGEQSDHFTWCLCLSVLRDTSIPLSHGRCAAAWRGGPADPVWAVGAASAGQAGLHT